MIRKKLLALLGFATLVASALVLAACAGMAGQGRGVALYDLSTELGERSIGPEGLAVTKDAIFPFVLEGVHTPTWLDHSTMQYRLAYAEPGRRYAFSESRWVATPAELIETALVRHQIVQRGRADGQGCQLRLDVDEFVQRFDTASTSQSVLDIRATLMTRRDARVLARRSFSYSHAAGQDARGGVAAHAAMLGRLSTELAQWLAMAASPSGNTIRECRSENL